MGRKRERDPRIDNPDGYEPVLARVTYTDSGYPASYADVVGIYGRAVMPSGRGPDWFWIFATPRSAEDMRRRGLRAVGTVTSTWIPAQVAPSVLDTLAEEDVPVVGTQEHADAMIQETREREALR